MKTDLRRLGSVNASRVLLAAPVVVFAAQGWAHRWMYDDGFINLRIVRQIEAGNGPVWNAGQRVEAFTSPLWMALLTVADLLTPIRLEWIAVVLGITLSAAGLALAIAGSSSLHRLTDPHAFLVPAGALVPVAVSPFWFWSSGGLEGGLTFAWLGAVLWLLARWATAPRRATPVLACALLGLGWLIRPELVIVSVLTVAVVGLDERGWPRRLRTIAAAFAFPAAYEVFRMGYFGSIVPNTALAKEASAARWSLGWSYFRDLFDTYWLWIPISMLAVFAYGQLFRGLHRAGNRRACLACSTLVASSALLALYVIRVGGDYLHGRLLLPAVFAFIAPVAVMRPSRARDRGDRRRSVGARFLREPTGAIAVIVVAVWALVSVSLFRPSLPYPNTTGPGHNVVTLDQTGWKPDGRMPAWFIGPWYDGPGVYLWVWKLSLAPGPEVVRSTVASWAEGVMGYGFGPQVDIFDMYALADPITARFVVAQRARPGHEKLIPLPWLIARLTAPSSIDPTGLPRLPYLTRPLIQPTMGDEFRRQVATLRRVMNCAPIKRLRASYAAPLIPARFFENILQSFGNSRLEIPPDPDQAERELCSNG